MIDGTGQAAIGLAVTMLTEATKSLMPPDKAKHLGPYLALSYSMLATVLYVISMPVLPGRMDVWSLFMGWLTVYCTAVGAYHAVKLTVGAAKRKAPADG